LELGGYINYFIKGIIIGVSVSAPLGPVALLCVQKTLNKGAITGFVSGMGASAADTIYAIIAAFGATFITNFVDTQQFLLRVTGGLLLIIFGIRIYLTNTIKQVRKQKIKKASSIGDFLSVFFVTISNPITILFFGAVFTGLGLVSPDSLTFSSFFLIGGVFTGTILWWFLLSTVISLFRHKIRLRSLWWINKIAGAMIFLLGVLAAVSILFIK
jgi:threonine/homoserine/homoserine lactone efflux protein